MQIILTEEEYNALKAASNMDANFHVRVGDMVADYQRKFRFALGQKLQHCRMPYDSVSITELRRHIDEAETIAKKIQ